MIEQFQVHLKPVLREAGRRHGSWLNVAFGLDGLGVSIRLPVRTRLGAGRRDILLRAAHIGLRAPVQRLLTAPRIEIRRGGHGDRGVSKLAKAVAGRIPGAQGAEVRVDARAPSPGWYDRASDTVASRRPRGSRDRSTLEAPPGSPAVSPGADRPPVDTAGVARHSRTLQRRRHNHEPPCPPVRSLTLAEEAYDHVGPTSCARGGGIDG